MEQQPLQPNGQMHDYQENELSLRDYIMIVRIHLNKILLTVVTVLGFSVYYTYTVPPEYHATATIMIREKPGASMIMDFGGARQRNQIINEIQLIKSRAVAEAVVEELWQNGHKNNLQIFKSRVFKPRGQRPRRMLKEILTFGLYDPESSQPKRYSGDYTLEIGQKFAGRIQSNLNINNRRDTDMLELSFKSPFPDEAKLVANTIAFVYMDLDKKWNSEQAGNLVDFLRSQVTVQSSKLAVAEEKLKTFKEKERIYDLTGNAPMVLGRLVEVETQYYNTLAEINISNEQAEYLRSKLSEDEKTLAEQLMNDMNIQVNSLRIAIGEYESQLMKNKNQYGENHAAVKDTRNKINALKDQLNDKTKTLIAQGVSVANPLEYRQGIITELLTIDAQKIGFESKGVEYKKLVNHYNGQLNELPGKQLDFARLERDHSVLALNYTFMRQKLEEAKINVASEAGKVQIVDIALQPGNPSKPVHSRNILLGLILGLGAGLGLAFLIEFLDNTVKTIDDIERKNLTVLGIIPSIGEDLYQKNRSFRKGKNPTRSTATHKKLKRRLITREDPRSPVSEAYRSLRTNLMYSSTDKEIKSILVSSAGPGEGKTTTVTNLAITYANLGKRTLLVDTDLRRPVIHKVFDCPRDPGVTSYLSGATDDFNSLIQESGIENLYLVTSGVLPPNPSELLGSKRMTDLVSSLEDEWDMVLFDSPPLVAVTDATMISKEIDQIVMVVKVGHTDKRAFNHTVTSLRNVNAPLGGVILNAVTSKNSYGSYYYYYQYYHYYGSEKESANA